MRRLAILALLGITCCRAPECGRAEFRFHELCSLSVVDYAEVEQFLSRHGIACLQGPSSLGWGEVFVMGDGSTALRARRLMLLDSRKWPVTWPADWFVLPLPDSDLVRIAIVEHTCTPTELVLGRLAGLEIPVILHLGSDADYILVRPVDRDRALLSLKEADWPGVTLAPPPDRGPRSAARAH